MTTYSHADVLVYAVPKAPALPQLQLHNPISLRLLHFLLGFSFATCVYLTT